MRSGFKLFDKDKKPVGAVERHGVRRNRYIISGWVDADEIGLALGDAQISQPPGMTRKDAGFELDLPLEAARPELWFLQGPKRQTVPLEPVLPRQIRAMRRRQILPFMRDLAKAFPAVIRWFLSRDRVARATVKQILGLNVVSRSPVLDSNLFQSTGDAPDSDQPRISIILPVYNAFDLVVEAVDRIERHTDLPWRLIVIEDCSTDDRVRPWLRRWYKALGAEDQARVTVLENEENQGFIGSVNRGFAQALPYGDHVVLLNSDALVPPDWASRLIRPLLDQARVASVTPMSNDAEIFNAPVICARGDLRPGQADALDRLAQRFDPDRVLKAAPTGVGFCMAMNIEALRLMPEFDRKFGRGYGEEVDWCRKLAARGWRHLGHGGVFVEHRGGMSFGLTEKDKQIEKNNKIISMRYQGYGQLVQDFISTDPLSSARLALALTWAGQRQGRVPVYLAHDLGGGAEHYLQGRITQNLEEEGLEEDRAAVVLRVGGVLAWQVELHCPAGLVCGATNDTGLVLQLMQLLPQRQVIYSCGAEAQEPMLVPKMLCDLGRGDLGRGDPGRGDPGLGAAHSLEIQFHDFLPISPSYTLLNSDGTYDGLPDPLGNTDRAHEAAGQGGAARISLAKWQEGWGRALDQAQKITVFSANSKALVAQAYPQVIEKIEITPHQLLQEVPEVPPGRAPDGVPVIGVLGNIGAQKGAGVLCDLSRHLARTGHARLVLLGNLDPGFTLARPARVHGAYEISDIPALIKRYGISRWLIPSIWPETFSYTTHEAIATGLPVWSFDLGAQGAAVAAAAAMRGQGGVVALEASGVIKLLDLMLQNAQEHG